MFQEQLWGRPPVILKEKKNLRTARTSTKTLKIGMSQNKDKNQTDFTFAPENNAVDPPSNSTPEDDHLSDNLPKEFSEEILKQYELPNVKVNLITLLRYGDRVDFVLQVAGSVMSIGGGNGVYHSTANF
jgi:hypothetical protein